MCIAHNGNAGYANQESGIMMTSNYDYIWKLLVCGQGGVGKTTLLHRYIHNEFVEDMKMTIGCQFHTQILERQGRNLNLVMWDLGGQDQFRWFQDRFFKGANGAIVVFDVHRLESISQVEDWVQLTRNNTSNNIPIVLLGNKCDLFNGYGKYENVREIATSLVEDLELNCYITTSAKNDINVAKTFDYITNLLLQRDAQKNYNNMILA